MTAPIVSPGYWCECRTRNTTTGDAPLLIASIDVETATQAVRWIRIALRALIPTLDAEAFDTAWDWLSLEYRSTVQALTAGEPRTFTITQAQTAIQWTVRPVHFLKLATRQGINLPPCAEQYNQPPQQPE
ncbi:hypothetical protein [Streptomyces sp. NPDC020965]|uniref:hypothetical protein n=1 Tax=Streptomyces sp. NPDC020965 TaxID=3365105 RepID=UPI003796178A